MLHLEVRRLSEAGTLREVSKYGVFSGSYFPAFGLNTERYSVSLRVQFKRGRIRTRKNSVFGHFSSSGTYSDPSVSGAALARGLPLFELRHLLEEIWL